MVKAIIPCAGYGTRMGMKLNESKETLIDPVTHKYLIDYSLDLCHKYKIEPIVISRLEKEDLNGYLRDKEVEHIVLKTPGKEWAETVLKSRGLWGDKNILILPDTRFDEKAIPRMLDLLHEYDLVAAIHEIPAMDCDKWGIINRKEIWEKPAVINKNIKAHMKAWGLLGFTPKVGEFIFPSLNKGNWVELERMAIAPSFVHLDKFIDITRSGTLEKY
jgi:dTDP-glucose pyrophosphorylase